MIKLIPFGIDSSNNCMLLIMFLIQFNVVHWHRQNYVRYFYLMISIDRFSTERKSWNKKYLRKRISGKWKHSKPWKRSMTSNFNWFFTWGNSCINVVCGGSFSSNSFYWNRFERNPFGRLYSNTSLYKSYFFKRNRALVFLSRFFAG